MPARPLRRARRVMFDALETRRLLTIQINQVLAQESPLDYVGPDAGLGGDGIQDLHLRITGLNNLAQVEYITIVPYHIGQTQPSGAVAGDLAWGAGTNPYGLATGKYIYSRTLDDKEDLTSADIYINPRVRSVAEEPTSSNASLGGATSVMKDLANNTSFKVTVKYFGLDEQNQLGTANLTVNGLPSSPPLMPATTPQDVLGGITVVSKGQEASLPADVPKGYVHLAVTSTVDLWSEAYPVESVSFKLSDLAGQAWTPGREMIVMPGANQNHKAVDIYYYQTRDESPAPGAAPTNTMTLAVQKALGDPSRVHVGKFNGAFTGGSGVWDPVAATDELDTAAIRYVNNASDLATYLAATSGSDVIYLTQPANGLSYIPIDQPLVINHSVIINGNGVTLRFVNLGYDGIHSETAAAGFENKKGAISVTSAASNATKSLRVEINNLSIDFDPTFWWRKDSIPGSTARWDAVRDPEGHAVIDLSSNIVDNINYHTYFKMNDVDITGPPMSNSVDAYNAYRNNITEVLSHYVGESAAYLLNTGFDASGAITGGVFRGGTLKFARGPWKVVGNVHNGALDYTYAAGAFAFSNAHDVLLQGNTVRQIAAANPNEPWTAGTMFRLVNFAGNFGETTYNNTVEDNRFGEGAGQSGGEMYFYYDKDGNRKANGANNPEAMLDEAGQAWFVGRPGAVSSDGYVVTMPQDLAARGIWTGSNAGPGFVASILAAVRADGTVDTTYAGQWFRVAHQLDTTSSSAPLQLLMQDALPAAPSGGYWILQIEQGFVNQSFINNQINLVDKLATGFSTRGSEYGLRVIGNTVTGGVATIYNWFSHENVYAVDPAIGISAGGAPVYDAIVSNNTIINSPLGIILETPHGLQNRSAGNPDGGNNNYGRVYLTVSATGNNFIYDDAFINGIWTTFVNYDRGSHVYDHDSNSCLPPPVPPTITVGGGMNGSGTDQGYVGIRMPWSVGGKVPWSASYFQYPTFIDPRENVVAVKGNTASFRNGNVLTPRSASSGQVFAGIINGALMASTIQKDRIPWDANPRAYYRFNQGNLDVFDSTSVVQNIQARLSQQDGSDFVGPGTGARTPDSIQDLHIRLVGLGINAALSSITIVNTADPTEIWTWSAGSPGTGRQFFVSRPAGSDFADIYVQPTATHFNSKFSLTFAFASGGSIDVPVEGVHFNPRLKTLPPSLAAPVGVSASAASSPSSGINVSWTPVVGASSYIVDWGTDKNDLINEITVNAAAFSHSGATAGTTYYYVIRAVGPSDARSPFSELASATASTSVSAQFGSVTGSLLAPIFIGAAGSSHPVASFTFTDTSAPASAFWATIDWGDGVQTPGVVVGGASSFTVNGAHAYSTYSNGSGFPVRVTIKANGFNVSDATTTTSQVVLLQVQQVNLSSFYNQVGITVNAQGGFAGSQSFASASLPSTGLAMGPYKFNLGPADQNNMIAANGQIIPVTPGNYTHLAILGAFDIGVSLGGQFQVDYTDGSYDRYYVGIGDWKAGYTGAGTTAPGETEVWKANGYNQYTGGSNTYTYQSTYIYGHMLRLDSTKQIQDVRLPTNSGLKILAIDAGLQTDSVNLTGYFNKVGITLANSTVAGEFTQYNESLLRGALGGSAYAGGVAFGFGPVDLTAQVFNVVAASGQSIYVNPGYYSGVALAAATAGFNQTLGGTFRIDYVDGTSEWFTQGISDWKTGYNGVLGATASGEFIVKAMVNAGAWNGSSNQATGTWVDVYGFIIPTDPTRQVKAIALPNETKLKILAITLVTPSSPASTSTPIDLSHSSSTSPVTFDRVGITSGYKAGDSTVKLTPAGDTYNAAELGTSLAVNGQVFGFGPASRLSAIGVEGKTIPLTQGNYTDVRLLGASGSGASETISFWINYVDGTKEYFTQVFSDWANGYTSGGTTAPNETIAKRMLTYNSLSGTVTGVVYLYQYIFPVDPTKTVASIQFPSGGTRISVLAINEVKNPEQVSLGRQTPGFAMPYGEVGITSNYPGAGQINAAPGAAGDSYPVATGPYPTGLPATLMWNGHRFNMGAANIPNEVPMVGRPIRLTPGNYTSLIFLGAAFFGHPETEQFKVHYTDGTYDTFTQGFSDWRNGYTAAGTTAPNETMVWAAPNYNNASGPASPARTAYLYGYTFALNPNKTVDYLETPNNRNIKIFAMDLVNEPTQANLQFGKKQAAAPANFAGITFDSRRNVGGGLDGNTNTYSLNTLGTSLVWNNQTFKFGAANSVDVIAANGQTVWLNPGSYASLQLLGASTSGVAMGDFVVTYTDNTVVYPKIYFSDWRTGYTGVGTVNPNGYEYVVNSGPYNNGQFNTTSGTAYLYGYIIQLDASKRVASIKLPTNTSIKILAINQVADTSRVDLGRGVDSAAPAFNHVGISSPSVPGVAPGQGMNGAGETYTLKSTAYSTDGLGNTVVWAQGGQTQTFNIGPASYLTPNVVQAGGPPIAITPGAYGGVYVLAAASSGYAISQFKFTLRFGTSTNWTASQEFKPDIGSWVTQTGASSGSLAGTMANYDSPTGIQVGTRYVYAFYVAISGSPGNLVAIETFNDANVKILAVNTSAIPRIAVPFSSTPPSSLIAGGTDDAMSDSSDGSFDDLGDAGASDPGVSDAGASDADGIADEAADPAYPYEGSGETSVVATDPAFVLTSSSIGGAVIDPGVDSLDTKQGVATSSISASQPGIIAAGRSRSGAPTSSAFAFWKPLERDKYSTKVKAAVRPVTAMA